MRKLLHLSLVMLVTTSAVMAEKARKIQFRTLCIEQVENLATVFILGAYKDSKPKEVALFTDVSPVISGVFETNEAVFYSEKPGADGKPERFAVGRAKIGKSTRQMFVFAPNDSAEDKLPYRIMAFDDDEKSFPMGNIRAINLAPVAVRYVLAGEALEEIPPGGFAQFPQSKKVNDYNLYPVVIQFKNPNDEWIESESSNWKASNRVREIGITRFASGTKQLAIRTYSDVPLWIKK